MDPRAKRTRQLLTQAFVSLLQQQSFQSITVQDIAARATVNRATFYAHFPDKHALLNYAIRDAFRQRLAQQLPDGAGFRAENVHTLVLTLCEFMAEFHSHCMPKDRQLLPLLEATITTELYEVLRSWLKGKGLAAMVASWAIYGAATQWAGEKRRGPVKEFVAQVLPMIMSALGSAVKVPVS